MLPEAQRQQAQAAWAPAPPGSIGVSLPREPCGLARVPLWWGPWHNVVAGLKLLYCPGGKEHVLLWLEGEVDQGRRSQRSAHRPEWRARVNRNPWEGQPKRASPQRLEMLSTRRVAWPWQLEMTSSRSNGSLSPWSKAGPPNEQKQVSDANNRRARHERAQLLQAEEAMGRPACVK